MTITTTMSTTTNATTTTTTLDELSDNVKRLQDKLRETQSNMLKIYQRANALSKQTAISSSSSSPTPTPIPVITTVTTEISPPIPSQEQEEANMINNREQEAKIQELEQELQRQREQLQKQDQEKQEQDREHAKQVESLQQKMTLLDNHNVILRESVTKYEQVVSIIAQKSHEKWLQDTQLLQRHVDTLSQQLQEQQMERESVHHCNIRLKALVQHLMNTMREVATQRETELIESKSGALELETENLRRMLKISEQYQSLDMYQD